MTFAVYRSRFVLLVIACAVYNMRFQNINGLLQDEVYTDGEIKRLREVQEILEKENIRLEAENFELRLELERSNVNTPRYQEKIQHLEK